MTVSLPDRQVPGKNRGRQRLKWISAACAALLFAAAAVLWWVGGELIAATHQAIGPLPADLAGRTVAFPTPAGEQCRGWFIGGRPGGGAVLLLHGVRGSRLDMLGRARLLSAHGYSVLLFDFPGHGESGGHHISFGFHEAQAVGPALQELSALAPGESLQVIATSMGAAAFVMARTRLPVGAVVVEAMYPTLRQAIQSRLTLRLGAWASILTPVLTWQLPPRLGFSVEDARPIDHIADLDAAVLVVAGSDDQRTTAAESQAIFDRAREPKALWMVPGAGHDDFYARDPAGYAQRVLPFLAQHQGPRRIE